MAVPGSQVGASSDEHLGDINHAIPRGQKQRRAFICVDAVHLASPLQQQLGHTVPNSAAVAAMSTKVQSAVSRAARFWRDLGSKPLHIHHVDETADDAGGLAPEDHALNRIL